MSAIIKDIIYIDVTRGDCIDDNRKAGSSNTGTYFICSAKNYESFQRFFDSENKYQLDVASVEIYKQLFNANFKQIKDQYKGKMEKFDEYIEYLISSGHLDMHVTIRENDSRKFMRFVDNNDDVTSAFRNVLYEDLSLIAIECIEPKKFLIYPVINKKYIESSFDCVLVLDE